MLQLVNSMHRKPRAQSPSIGIIMQRTLPIGYIYSADIQNELRQHNGLRPDTWSTAGLDNERDIYEDEIYMLRGIVSYDWFALFA